MSRCIILAASSSPMMVVLSLGSHVIFRFVRTAMSQSWLMVSLRTAWSNGLIVGLRDLTASRKFW